MSRVWKSPDGRDYIIASKGAPEAVMDLCHIDGERAGGRLMGQAKALAAKGLRVLGVAKSAFREADLPGGQHDFVFEFLGFMGFEDPVRPGVKEAIRECHKAGIRVIMITGDYPATAQKIAMEIGLNSASEMMTGAELEQMTDEELGEKIGRVNIFARAVPEQKLKIIKALKLNGEVVAMTGDGVNDAPALKAADIGIAMGSRGTDVARESSALVLVDDDFTSIVSAAKMGRRIFDNLKKAMSYIFAVHVPIAGMSLIPILFKWPLSVPAGAHRVPGTYNRPRVLGGFRGRARRTGHNGPPAEEMRRTPFRQEDRHVQPPAGVRRAHDSLGYILFFADKGAGRDGSEGHGVYNNDIR